MRLSDNGLTLTEVDIRDIMNGTVAIPESVTRIRAYAFLNCSDSTQRTIPNPVTFVRRAFIGCSGLTQLTIPNPVTRRALTHLTIPNSVTALEVRALALCTDLIVLTIGNSITYMGEGAFHGCDNLQVIVIDARNNEDFERIRSLLPENLRDRAIPKALYLLIIKAKEQALFSDLFNHHPLQKKLPKDVVNNIQQFDDRLHDRINQASLPRNAEDLPGYHDRLQAQLGLFYQKQEASSMIEKLNGVIDEAEKAISQRPTKYAQRITFHAALEEATGKTKNINYREKIKENQERIAVIKKLIRWLENDATVTFSEEEKALLNKPRGSVATILNGHWNLINNLPMTNPGGSAAIQ